MCFELAKQRLTSLCNDIVTASAYRAVRPDLLPPPPYELPTFNAPAQLGTFDEHKLSESESMELARREASSAGLEIRPTSLAHLPKDTLGLFTTIALAKGVKLTSYWGRLVVAPSLDNTSFAKHERALKTKKKDARQNTLFIIGSRCCATTYANSPKGSRRRPNCVLEETSFDYYSSMDWNGLVSLYVQRAIDAGGELLVVRGSTKDVARDDSQGDESGEFSLKKTFRDLIHSSDESEEDIDDDAFVGEVEGKEDAAAAGESMLAIEQDSVDAGAGQGRQVGQDKGTEESVDAGAGVGRVVGQDEEMEESVNAGAGVGSVVGQDEEMEESVDAGAGQGRVVGQDEEGPGNQQRKGMDAGAAVDEGTSADYEPEGPQTSNAEPHAEADASAESKTEEDGASDGATSSDQRTFRRSERKRKKTERSKQMRKSSKAKKRTRK